MHDGFSRRYRLLLALYPDEMTNEEERTPDICFFDFPILFISNLSRCFSHGIDRISFQVMCLVSNWIDPSIYTYKRVFVTVDSFERIRSSICTCTGKTNSQIVIFSPLASCVKIYEFDRCLFRHILPVLTKKIDGDFGLHYQAHIFLRCLHTSISDEYSMWKQCLL